MYNTMNGVNVAEKLGLGSETRELKFGSSFTAGGRSQQQGSSHSVRYDFKPASVDTSKMATLDVGPNGQVTISMPNVDANGTTVFKGARKPYAKECVLIIDQDTGEVVLEKLTHNIQVKRTREEGGSKKSSGLSMPSAPAPPPPAAEMKKTQPSSSTFKQDPKIVSREEPKKAIPPKSISQIQHQHQPNPSKRSPMPSHHQRQSPNTRPSPGHVTSPPLSFSPSAASAGSSSQESARPGPAKQQPAALLSLTNFDDLLTMAPISTQSTSLKPIDKLPVKDNSSLSVPIAKSSSAGTAGSGNVKNVSALSESSSGEDSSSSSSSEDDDDDSSDMEEVLDKVPIPPVAVPVESSRSPALVNSNSRGRPQPVAPSMPTDLLCEDLQLSESGSDSD